MFTFKKVHINSKVKFNLSVVALLVIFAGNYLFYKNYHQGYDKTIKTLLNYTRVNIESIPYFTELYIENGNKQIVDKINETVLDTEKNITALKSGGVIMLSNEAFLLKKIRNEQLAKSMDVLVKRIDDLKNSLNIIFTENHNSSAAKNALENIKRNNYKLVDQTNLIINEAEDYFSSSKMVVQSIIILVNVLAVGILFYMISLIKLRFFASINSIKAAAKTVSEGATNTDISIDLKENGELGELSKYVEKISQNIHDATTFALGIGEGKFDTELTSINTTNGLGKALIDMRNKLKQVAEEENKRTWAVNGEAKFSEILRTHQNSSIEEISLIYIQNLVKYLNANQGAVYLINESDPDNKYIEPAACYAYERSKKAAREKIEIGEGLVGQCVIENDFIYMDDVPENFVKITSGLGQSNPKSVLLVPIKVNDKAYGVIEIASFNPIEQYQIKFIETICESFAATISNTRINANTQRLLEESTKITEELKSKEEILRQNTEELVATQEELNRKLIEIEKESALTQSIVQAINKTNAALELDMEGNVIEVNDMYLSLMEYSREELIGKPERNLVAQDELDSEKYSSMWNSIKGGAFNSGEFKRISKSGREIWLTGTYSPIYDMDGKPYKIVQFAQFTTEQKERELELTSKLNAFNNSVPSLEVNLNGNIESANSIFLQEFGYKKLEIKNKALADILDSEFIPVSEYQDILSNISEGQVITKSLKFKTKEGQDKFFLCSFSSSLNLTGDVQKVLLIMIDTTEQIKLQEQFKNRLLEEKRKNAILKMQTITTGQFIEELGEIFSQLEEKKDVANIEKPLRDKKIPTLEFDFNGKINLVNEFALNILGEAEEKIINSSLYKLLHFTNEDELRSFNEQLAKGELVQLKTMFKIREESPITFNVIITPLYKNGKKHNNLLIFMNVESFTS
jgi:PAS domain S-box-containing protein